MVVRFVSSMDLNYHRGGSGEPLVLLHGIGARWEMWTPVLGALQDRHDVLAPDLPGFGASPMPAPGTPPGIDSLCDLLLEWLADQGVAAGSFHVAGNSMGGEMALELGRRGAARTACALSPAGFASPAEMTYAKGTLRVALASARRLAPRADRLLARPRARKLMLNTFFARPQLIPPVVAAADMRAMAGAPWFDDTLPTITPFDAPDGIAVPTTIAWGAKDRLLLPRQAERARAMLPAATIVMLPGCGHVPTWDDPALVARVMLEAAAAA